MNFGSRRRYNSDAFLNNPYLQHGRHGVEDQLILNRYRPISEAGSGGFATVQLAWDTRIQRRVAIKCIHLKEEDVAQGVLPGLDEARTAAMLNDATIVGVYDFEVQGSTAYLIMEYVDGLTLTQLMDFYDEQLSLDVIASIFSAVATALEIAHENQVLHLDIKPDNILINRQGQVKVTDFGLATLSDAVGFGAAAGGTIGYMPPEQMRQESLDARCDEWALASVLYEMLTGENPFLVSNLDQAEAAIENAEIVLPSLCKEGLPSAADDVLFFALDPDRAERYANVTDFAEEMERFLGNPVKGQRELAVLIGQASEDFEEEEEAAERVVFFDRLSDRSRSAIARTWSFLNAAILGFVGLSNTPLFGGWENPVFWGLLALIALAAVLKPHLGACLALISLTTALFANGAFISGGLMIVIVALWWFFVGRWGNHQTNTALAPALFGTFGFNQLTPLMAGFLLTIKDVLINVFFALFLSFVLAGFGSGSLFGWNSIAFWETSSLQVEERILALMQQPETWCIVLAWLAAALVMRLFCLRQTRLFAFFGALVATFILLGGLSVGAFLSTGQATWLPEWQPLIITIGAGIVMAVFSALGVPIRSTHYYEEEQ